jgi:uncharacterized protein (DUF885 family)
MSRAIRHFLPLTLAVSLAACTSPAPPKTARAEDASTMSESQRAARTAFHAVSDRFLAEYLRRQPVAATLIGSHEGDGAWPDLSSASESAMRAFLDQIGGELAAIPRAELDQEDRVDAAILDNQLASWRFELDEVREPEWNPLIYTGLIGDGIDPLVTRNFAPLASRAKSLRSRLEAIPSVVAVAKARLGLSSRVHVETAIAQVSGLIELCEHDIGAAFATLPAAERKPVEQAAAKAATALTDLRAFFERDLSGRATLSFRLGRAKFEKRLRYALEDDVDIDRTAADAWALLQRTQHEMAETAKELWPSLMPGRPLPELASPEAEKAFVRSVLDEVAKDHSDSATIVADAARLLEETTAFVRAKDLVRVPDEPCRVIEMPEYRRGVAIAYCDSSGPLEATQETFYAIAPTPKDWPAERALSFYREYNRSMLADLTIHEAMPGHYLQAMHANRFHSPIRAVFASGPFVEGWAVYGEWVMQHHGFGGANVRIERQKMVLRLAANAILDHGVHAGAMEEREALALMVGEAFQEQGEAIGKWKRARLTSAQLTTYFYGFSEMMRMREHAEKKPRFTERAYHDALLAHGSPAMKHIRSLLED